MKLGYERRSFTAFRIPIGLFQYVVINVQRSEELQQMLLTNQVGLQSGVEDFAAAHGHDIAIFFHG